MPRLRRPVAADAAGVLSVHGDPRCYPLDPGLMHRKLRDSEEFIESIDHHWQRHGFGYWAVLVPRDWWPEGVPDREDEDWVHAGLGGIQHHELNGEPVLNVYYRFGPSVQGRGIAAYVLDEAKARRDARPPAVTSSSGPGPRIRRAPGRRARRVPRPGPVAVGGRHRIARLAVEKPA